MSLQHDVVTRAAGAPGSPPPGYRPALDGVRAVAVVSVMCYHLSFDRVRGGFLGVDAFFVLSGYLITSLLLTERLDRDRIRLAEFWARRARRLFPALALLVAVVALGIHHFVPMPDWPLRRQDLLWTVFYGANWHAIASEQDYFAQWATASPLRHMWSLAIEEQFYVLWPVLLVGLTRKGGGGRGLLLVLGGAIGVSVGVMALVYDPGGPSRAYYGTDARVHEPLVGALLAVLMSTRGELAGPGLVRRAGPIGAAALVGVLGALVFVSDRASGYYRGGSLAFALAVAALLWAIEVEPAGRVGRALGARGPRWIGEISYGLYLWHWPVILFAPGLLHEWLGRDAAMVTGNRWALAVVQVGLTFGVASASYYAVERPIRRGALSRRLGGWRLLVAAPATAAVLVALLLWATRVPAESLALVEKDGYRCPEPGFVCVRHREALARPTLVLMGDSIAKSLDPAVLKLSQRLRWTYVAAAANRCSLTQRWIASITADGPARLVGWESCYNAVPQIHQEVLNYAPRLIVAADRWLLLDSLDDAGQRLAAGSEPHIRDMERRLEATARLLTSKGATLVFVHTLAAGRPLECADPRYGTRPGCAARVSDDRLTPQYNAMMDRIAARLPDRVRAIDFADEVCPGGACPPFLNGVLVRVDQLHFSAPFADSLAPRLERKLEQVGVRLG